MTDFKLPELGENVAGGDVLRILVKPGDTLPKDQPVLELETDKATIEVPSSVAGKVIEVKVKVGDKVKVGQAILASMRPKPPLRQSRQRLLRPRAARADTAPAASANSAGAAAAHEPGLEQHGSGSRRPTEDKSGTIEAPASRPVAAEPPTRWSTSTVARGRRRSSRAGRSVRPRRRRLGAPPGARAGRRHQPGVRQRPERPHLRSTT